MKKINPKKGIPVWHSVLLGGIGAVLTAAVISMLFALLIVHNVLPAKWIPYLSYAATGIGVFIAAWILCAQQQDNRLLIAMGAGAVCFAAIKTIQLLCIPATSDVWLSAGICAAAAFAGALCTAGKGRRRHRR